MKINDALRERIRVLEEEAKDRYQEILNRSETGIRQADMIYELDQRIKALEKEKIRTALLITRYLLERDEALLQVENYKNLDS